MAHRRSAASDIATRKLQVTFFKNQFAASLTTKSLSLPKLRDLILKTQGKTKSKLPWLKLARFGDKRTDKNSLRHDANVNQFSGIELDYDGEQKSFDDGVATLRKIGVRCLVYTSPSHTNAAPRWRVLMPVSRKLPLDMRAKLVARVNGRFGGVFKGVESFTLSQSFYYGLALDNPAPDHRAEVIDGRMIDQCDDLVEFEKDGWPKGGPKNNANSGDAPRDAGYWFREFGRQSRTDDDGPHGFEEHIARVGDGESLGGFNDPLSRSAAAYVTEHGVDIDRSELKRLLRVAINAAPKKATRKAADIKRYLGDHYLDDIIASALRKFGEYNTNTNNTSSSLPTISATPFIWIDPEKIPPRRWLYHPNYIRQFTSLTLSTGGVGKSSQLIVEALAMITGRPLLDIKPVKKLRAWYFNGEDPTEELQRRFAAAALHYKINEDDISDGYLFVDSGRIMPIVLVEEGRHGTIIAVPVVEQVIATIRDRKIDVLIVDPFVATHRVPENDNGAIERVAKAWSHIAEACNCSIMLAHHTRKTQGGNAVSVEDGRGAGALLAAVRVARTLNTMSDSEAKEAGVKSSERGRHYRSDVGKANLTPPAEKADWFKIVSIDLGNTGRGEADTVGVVTAWDYPAFKSADVDDDDTTLALAAIKAGGPWRSNPQATTHPWVGVPIAQALRIDLNTRHGKKNVTELIADWLQRGLLERVGETDPASRKVREFIVVRTKQPTPDPKPKAKRSWF
jgi:hypothetical protein